MTVGCPQCGKKKSGKGGEGINCPSKRPPGRVNPIFRGQEEECKGNRLPKSIVVAILSTDGLPMKKKPEELASSERLDGSGWRETPNRNFSFINNVKGPQSQKRRSKSKDMGKGRQSGGDLGPNCALKNRHPKRKEGRERERRRKKLERHGEGEQPNVSNRKKKREGDLK